VGIIFIAHGWPKFKNLKQNAENFAMMGFKPGAFWGTIVALVEFLGGLALIAGFLTQIAALLIAIDMLVAFLWKVKGRQKLVGGFELDLLLMSTALMIATIGSGMYGLDSYWPIALY
jgi:putative oxidoreductase